MCRLPLNRAKYFRDFEHLRFWLGAFDQSLAVDSSEVLYRLCELENHCFALEVESSPLIAECQKLPDIAVTRGNLKSCGTSKLPRADAGAGTTW